MLHKAMLQYLEEIGSSVSKSENIYAEHYEEEVLTSDRVNIRIRLRFASGYLLELNEAAIVDKEKVSYLAYRYHFQDNHDNLIFRYDNTPHFPKIASFPHHKHVKDQVLPCAKPSILMVIDEAILFSAQIHLK